MSKATPWARIVCCGRKSAPPKPRPPGIPNIKGETTMLKMVTLVCGIMGIIAAAQAAPVTPAKMTGPIPVTAGSDEPYRGAGEQPVAGPGLPPPLLIPFGYVEEEYFV